MRKKKNKFQDQSHGGQSGYGPEKPAEKLTGEYIGSMRWRGGRGRWNNITVSLVHDSVHYFFSGHRAHPVIADRGRFWSID